MQRNKLGALNLASRHSHQCTHMPRHTQICMPRHMQLFFFEDEFSACCGGRSAYLPLGNRIHVASVVAPPRNPKNPNPAARSSSSSSEPQLVQLYVLHPVALGQGLERDALDLSFVVWLSSKQ